MIRPYHYPVRIVVVLMTLYGLMLLNWQEGSLRFTSPCLNVLSLTLSLTIPLACAVLLLIAPRRNAWRIGIAVGLGLPAIPSLGMAALCLQAGQKEITTNCDSDFELIQTVPISGAPTRIYREFVMLSPDCVVIRQEYPVFPGLIWISTLHEEEWVRDAKVQVLDAHRFRCTFQPDCSEMTEEMKRRGMTITLTAK